jgi:hypothetical protein
MNTFVLIVVLNIGAYAREDNSAITTQEFHSKTQCEYAADVIRKTAKRIASLTCINK